MHDSNRGNEPTTLGAFGYFAAIFLSCAIVGALAYNFGRQNERRQQTPASYAQAAKSDAQNACVDREGTTAFECIYEKVEASQEQARGEQDLTAQQVAANSAFLSAIIALFTLIITGVGAWLIRETLVATQNAVSEAEKATAAANAAVRETTRIGEAQVRCYLTGKNADIYFMDDGVISFSGYYTNTGQSPVIDLTVNCVLWLMVGDWIKHIDKEHFAASERAYTIGGAGTEERIGPNKFALKLHEIDLPPISRENLIYIQVVVTLTGKDVFGCDVENIECFHAADAGPHLKGRVIKLKRGHKMRERE